MCPINECTPDKQTRHKREHRGRKTHNTHTHTHTHTHVLTRYIIGDVMPKEDKPMDKSRIWTVLLLSVVMSKKGGLSSCLFFSLIFLFWFFKCRMARR